MPSPINFDKFKQLVKSTDRYAEQLQRLREKVKTDCIEKAVSGAMATISVSSNPSLVIFGEPQSGKTEMMICLTAKLLDEGHSTIVHLMNDSVDLLAQNLRRFENSKLSPAPISSTEFLRLSIKSIPEPLVVFCKKNARDLEKLIARLEGAKRVVVIDDEADYATPNAKINKGTKTPINKLVEQLLGSDGCYVGVTATPARLDLNNTLKNDTDKWVNFEPHSEYNGKDDFFPVGSAGKYRRTVLTQPATGKDAKDALVRFLVTVAYLNTDPERTPDNYSMLVHTSGKTLDHQADRAAIEECIFALKTTGKEFEEIVTLLLDAARQLYPDSNSEVLASYVVKNIPSTKLIVLNGKRDRSLGGETAAEPPSPFTVIIGGNIVSRGVTFKNLLSMFFTRSVKAKLQQDTYIQRARMFGTRRKYLPHFELTIPSALLNDWNKCFVFHRLALATIFSDSLGSPIWIGDKRVSVVSPTSVDQATVSIGKSEMGYAIFNFTDECDSIVETDRTSTATLNSLQALIGPAALPSSLIALISNMRAYLPGTLAIHRASSIANYGSSANQDAISREKGFMGNPQMELKAFPTAVHHIKIFYNAKKRARVFYKFTGGLALAQNFSKMA
jgi:hypothetical protein